MDLVKDKTIKGRKAGGRGGGQSYQPSGRGGEGPEEGSIMSSEVTLYLHPLLSGPGMMEPSRERGMEGKRLQSRREWGGGREEKCRNGEMSQS